ncbi:hypothetical protein [Streptomyces sp. RKAG290]|uniref:DUF7224 domain-containing protein n=1 Tax=Streptomyces sp. RKAG290 TaxID=2888348 RepID=UPI002033474F|nr:hypothetical protein [Streptomyces sp. RKAG290]MCM2412590.1 hypothetical protein [Streptomyces sp. RKAG290]
MSRYAAGWRTSSALWAAPLVLVLVWYVSSASGSGHLAYWGRNTPIVAYCLPFYAPAVAACAAWEAGRLRRAGVSRLGPVRNRYAIALRALVPVLALGVAAIAASLLAMRIKSGPAHDWPHLGVLGMCALLVVVHAMFGYAAGNVLPRLLAPPLVLIADYLALVLPKTVTDPMWLRELTGMLDPPHGDLTTTVNPSALVAPALVAVGFALAVLIAAELTRVRGSRLLGALVSTGACVSCLAVFTVAAVSPVRAWEGDPPPWPRTDPPVCTGAAPRICVPEEAGGELDRLARTAHSVLPRLAAAGAGRPERLAAVSEAVHLEQGTWRVYAEPDMAEVQVKATLAVSPLTALPSCPPGSGDTGTLAAWLMLKAGIKADDVEQLLGNAVFGTLEARVLKLPESDQRAWFTRNMKLLDACKPTPQTAVDYAGTGG